MKPLEESVKNYVSHEVEVNLARGYGVDRDSGQIIYRRRGQHPKDAKNVTGTLLKIDENGLVVKVRLSYIQEVRVTNREYHIPMNAVRTCELARSLGGGLHVTRDD